MLGLCSNSGILKEEISSSQDHFKSLSYQSDPELGVRVIKVLGYHG